MLERSGFPELLTSLSAVIHEARDDGWDYSVEGRAGDDLETIVVTLKRHPLAPLVLAITAFAKASVAAISGANCQAERKVTGFFGLLTEEQQAREMAYDGDDTLMPPSLFQP